MKSRSCEITYTRFGVDKHGFYVKDSILSTYSEETFGSVGFEGIFAHLEIISNRKPIKVCNDNIDISKSSSLKRTKIFT